MHNVLCWQSATGQFAVVKTPQAAISAGLEFPGPPHVCVFCEELWGCSLCINTLTKWKTKWGRFNYPKWYPLVIGYYEINAILGDKCPIRLHMRWHRYAHLAPVGILGGAIVSGLIHWYVTHIHDRVNSCCIPMQRPSKQNSSHTSRGRPFFLQFNHSAPLWHNSKQDMQRWSLTKWLQA